MVPQAVAVSQQQSVAMAIASALAAAGISSYGSSTSNAWGKFSSAQSRRLRLYRIQSAWAFFLSRSFSSLNSLSSSVSSSFAGADGGAAAFPKAPVSLFLSFSLTSPWLTAPVAAGEAYHKLSY